MSNQAIAALIIVLTLLALIVLLRFRHSVFGTATVKANEARQGLDLADGTPDFGGGDGGGDGGGGD